MNSSIKITSQNVDLIDAIALVIPFCKNTLNSKRVILELIALKQKIGDGLVYVLAKYAASVYCTIPISSDLEDIGMYNESVVIFHYMRYWRCHVLEEMLEKQKNGHFATMWSKRRFSRDVVPKLNKGLKLVIFENGVPCANCYKFGGEPQFFHRMYYSHSTLGTFEHEVRESVTSSRNRPATYSHSQLLPTQDQMHYICGNCQSLIECDECENLVFDFVDFETLAPFSKRPEPHISYKHISKQCAKALFKMQNGIVDEFYVHHRYLEHSKGRIKDYDQVLICL